jgi:hypothetical protein
MRKSLAMAAGLCLTLGLLAAGCDDDPDSPGVDARADGGDGGATDGHKDGTSDGVTRLDGGDASEVNSEVGSETASEPDLAPEVPSTPVTPTTWTICTDPKNGIAAADFCAQYGVACGFDPAGGTAGAERYKSVEDCVAKYNIGSTARRGCVAYHLCVASQDAASKALHCQHPPQANLPVPVGPGPCGNM